MNCFKRIMIFCALLGGFGFCVASEPVSIDLKPYFGNASASAVFSCPAKKETLVYNRSDAETRISPCSTFKIVATLMGLDTGVLKGKETRLGYDGTKYDFKDWNHDVTLEEAFRASCVWYYKKLTDRLTKDYVQKTLDRLGYGNCDISVWNEKGHNGFWLESCLRISPAEQVLVLEKIFSEKSGFRPEHVALLKELMRYESIGKVGFYGKTGTGRNPATNRLEGRLAGFLTFPDGTVVYYAAHMADPARDISGPDIRPIFRKLVEKGALNRLASR